MSAPVAPPTPTTSFEPPGRSSGTPAGVPPDGPPFDQTLATEWARTAVAEGQKETQSRSGSDSAGADAGPHDGRGRHGAGAAAVSSGANAAQEAEQPAEPTPPIAGAAATRSEGILPSGRTATTLPTAVVPRSFARAVAGDAQTAPGVPAVTAGARTGAGILEGTVRPGVHVARPAPSTGVDEAAGSHSEAGEPAGAPSGELDEPPDEAAASVSSGLPEGSDDSTIAGATSSPVKVAAHGDLPGGKAGAAAGKVLPPDAPDGPEASPGGAAPELVRTAPTSTQASGADAGAIQVGAPSASPGSASGLAPSVLAGEAAVTAAGHGAAAGGDGESASDGTAARRGATRAVAARLGVAGQEAESVSSSSEAPGALPAAQLPTAAAAASTLAHSPAGAPSARTETDAAGAPLTGGEAAQATADGTQASGEGVAEEVPTLAAALGAGRAAAPKRGSRCSPMASAFSRRSRPSTRASSSPHAVASHRRGSHLNRKSWARYASTSRRPRQGCSRA